MEKEHRKRFVEAQRQVESSMLVSYNHLTEYQLDAQHILMITAKGFQDPPSHSTRTLMYKQLPTSREKEEAEAIIANMNLDLSPEQALGVQQRRIIDDDVLKKQIKTKDHHN